MFRAGRFALKYLEILDNGKGAFRFEQLVSTQVEKETTLFRGREIWDCAVASTASSYSRSTGNAGVLARSQLEQRPKAATRAIRRNLLTSKLTTVWIIAFIFINREGERGRDEEKKKEAAGVPTEEKVVICRRVEGRVRSSHCSLAFKFSQAQNELVYYLLFLFLETNWLCNNRPYDAMFHIWRAWKASCVFNSYVAVNIYCGIECQYWSSSKVLPPVYIFSVLSLKVLHISIGDRQNCEEMS